MIVPAYQVDTNIVSLPYQGAHIFSSERSEERPLTGSTFWKAEKWVAERNVLREGMIMKNV